MDILPGEAHWLNGRVERRIAVFKRTSNKFCSIDTDITVDQAKQLAVAAMDEQDKEGRQSPTEHVLGRSQHHDDEDGLNLLDGSPAALTARRRALPEKPSARRSSRTAWTEPSR